MYKLVPTRICKISSFVIIGFVGRGRVELKSKQKDFKKRKFGKQNNITDSWVWGAGEFSLAIASWLCFHSRDCPLLVTLDYQDIQSNRSVRIPEQQGPYTRSCFYLFFLVPDGFSQHFPPMLFLEFSPDR